MSDVDEMDEFLRLVAAISQWSQNQALTIDAIDAIGVRSQVRTAPQNSAGKTLPQSVPAGFLHTLYSLPGQVVLWTVEGNPVYVGSRRWNDVAEKLAERRGWSIDAAHTYLALRFG